MKTNHRRSQKCDTGGFNYSFMNFVRRFKRGLGADHDGGHRGSARDIREAKRQVTREERRKLDRQLSKEVTDAQHLRQSP